MTPCVFPCCKSLSGRFLKLRRIYWKKVKIPRGKKISLAIPGGAEVEKSRLPFTKRRGPFEGSGHMPLGRFCRRRNILFIVYPRHMKLAHCSHYEFLRERERERERERGRERVKSLVFKSYKQQCDASDWPTSVRLTEEDSIVKRKFWSTGLFHVRYTSKRLFQRWFVSYLLK